jgi:hypothetical protein
MTPVFSVLRAVLVASLVVFLAVPRRADACGCFTPPNPSVPVVQVGERILFSVHQGQVTAHVQVQYSGTAGTDFGWLLPLPSVPTLELGTDELFTRLTNATQPQYQLQTVRDSSCQYLGYGGGMATGGGTATGGNSSADAGIAGPPVVVVQDSVGPYDYAVLRADSKVEMLGWLTANHYFVPAGTDDAVAPYIQPGAYFLALKLRAGKTTGDLQPVVLHYASDLGVIPLTLTSTGAQQNMGIQVWMLGEGRAIPRNYAHTVLNDSVINWQQAGANYNDVVIRAVGEAPGKHAFITEYAGAAAPVAQAMLPTSRFGTKEELAAQPTAQAFVQYLWTHGFGASTLANPAAGLSLGGPLKAILAERLPPPPGVDPENFYRAYGYYLPQAPPQDYQPVALADAIWTQVVVPTQKAAALFTSTETLTRLYTTISPADMNRDPAFSFNPSLPAVSNVHLATMTVSCESNGYTPRHGVLVTEQGWRLEYPNGPFSAPAVDVATLPGSLRIEVLREEGPPEVLTDNQSLLPGAPVVPSPFVPMPRSGCTVVDPGVVLVLLALLTVARGARSRQAAQGEPSRSGQ